MGSDLLPFDTVAAFVAAVSVIGVLLLAPLYLSQRRDVRRLRAWMEREPGHPAQDLARSEQLLDRAERELEDVYAERGEPVPGTGEMPAVTAVRPGAAGGATEPMPAAARVTGERPALERITMERAALIPHPRWRRFVARATQPRVLAVVGVLALVLGAAAIVASERLLQSDETAQAPVDPAGIEVAVLNGTTASGLAGEVSRRISESGFLPGDVANYTDSVDRTIVMYAPGQRRAGTRVARELSGSPAIQELDRQAQRLAPEADVVVIVGADQAARG